MPALAQPVALKKIGEKSFRIAWSDGVAHEYSAQTLRRACGCAGCRDERTGQTLLDPKTVSADIAIKNAQVVGNYALSFTFSDGHATGIYPFPLLRALANEQENPLS